MKIGALFHVVFGLLFSIADIPARASLCRLQPSYFHGLDDTRADSSKRRTFVNNQPIMSAIKQKEVPIIID